MKLQHLNLLLKGGDHCYHLLKLDLLVLVSMLQVYNRMGVLVHQLASGF
jgi:hypothetical protein